MHELSIAMSILEMAEEQGARHGGPVLAVYLRLGRLSGVVKDALLSAYELAREGTAAAESRLVIEEVPIKGFCPACDAPRILESIQSFACPECGAPVSEILEGRELEVRAVEIAEREQCRT